MALPYAFRMMTTAECFRGSSTRQISQICSNLDRWALLDLALLKQGLSGDLRLWRVARQRLYEIVPDVFVSVSGAHLHEATVIHGGCCPRDISERTTIRRYLPWIPILKNSASTLIG